MSQIASSAHRKAFIRRTRDILRDTTFNYTPIGDGYKTSEEAKAALRAALESDLPAPPGSSFPDSSSVITDGRKWYLQRELRRGLEGEALVNAHFEGDQLIVDDEAGYMRELRAFKAGDDPVAVFAGEPLDDNRFRSVGEAFEIEVEDQGASTLEAVLLQTDEPPVDPLKETPMQSDAPAPLDAIIGGDDPAPLDEIVGKRDVSGEARDRSGEWTGGGGESARAATNRVAIAAFDARARRRGRSGGASDTPSHRLIGMSGEDFKTIYRAFKRAKPEHQKAATDAYGEMMERVRDHYRGLSPRHQELAMEHIVRLKRAAFQKPLTRPGLPGMRPVPIKKDVTDVHGDVHSSESGQFVSKDGNSKHAYTPDENARSGGYNGVHEHTRPLPGAEGKTQTTQTSTYHSTATTPQEAHAHYLSHFIRMTDGSLTPKPDTQFKLGNGQVKTADQLASQCQDSFYQHFGQVLSRKECYGAVQERYENGDYALVGEEHPKYKAPAADDNEAKVEEDTDVTPVPHPHAKSAEERDTAIDFEDDPAAAAREGTRTDFMAGIAELHRKASPKERAHIESMLTDEGRKDLQAALAGKKIAPAKRVFGLGGRNPAQEGIDAAREDARGRGAMERKPFGLGGRNPGQEGIAAARAEAERRTSSDDERSGKERRRRDGRDQPYPEGKVPGKRQVFARIEERRGENLGRAARANAGSTASGTKIVEGKPVVSGLGGQPYRNLRVNHEGKDYHVQAQIFDEPSEYGIPGHRRISRLNVKEKYPGPDVINYDRGWDLKPKTPHHKGLVQAITRHLERTGTNQRKTDRREGVKPFSQERRQGGRDRRRQDLGAAARAQTQKGVAMTDELEHHPLVKVAEALFKSKFDEVVDEIKDKEPKLSDDSARRIAAAAGRKSIGAKAMAERSAAARAKNAKKARGEPGSIDEVLDSYDPDAPAGIDDILKAEVIAVSGTGYGRMLDGSLEELLQRVRDPVLAGSGCQYPPKLDQTGSVIPRDYNSKDPQHYANVVGTYPDFCIVECNECKKSWKVPFAIDDDGKVTTGEPEEAAAEYVVRDGGDDDGDEEDETRAELDAAGSGDDEDEEGDDDEE
jgi:hypothetical protein